MDSFQTETALRLEQVATRIGQTTEKQAFNGQCFFFSWKAKMAMKRTE